MSPEEAIVHIEKSFPNLELRRSKEQSSFSLPGLGSLGRVVRIKHEGARPFKRAASSLKARQVGLKDGTPFELAIPALPDEIDALVWEEVLIAEAQEEEQTGYEVTLQALVDLGGTATREEILLQVLKANSGYELPDNVRKHLIMLSVNDPKRRAFRAHNTMRRGVQAEANLDRVFKGAGEGKDTTYQVYDPVMHGIWVGRVNGVTWSLERRDPGVADLVAQSDIEFDPASPAEGRKIVARQIAARRGQGKFRQGLLTAYGGRCCVTGCSVEGLLEAAHITPHNGISTNVLDNGLLLRADLHTLLDLGLMRIDPETMKVELHPTVVVDANYAKFQGVVTAKASAHPPSKKALQAQRDSCAHLWLEVSEFA